MKTGIRRMTGMLLTGAVVIVPILSGCKAKENTTVVVTGGASTSTLPTKAAPSSGQEVAEVKAMIGEMKNLKDVQGLSEFFTNESAAALGMVMMIPVAMIAAFEDMGSQMATELGKIGGAGQTAQPPKPSGGPKVKAELEVTLKKYGLTDKTQPTDKQAMASVTARGREFFRDMTGLLQKLDKDGKAKDGFNLSPDKAPNPEEAKYEVLSPTRVKVTPTNPKDKMMEQMEARFEDGRWRLHFGSFEELMKKAGPGMGAMGGGMGMPGGGPPMGGMGGGGHP